LKLLRYVVDNSSLLLGKLKRKQRVVIPRCNSVVKINIGCGLAVAPGWINIDGSFNAVVANFPPFFHRIAYNFSGASRYYTEVEYYRLLSDNIFFHHDLANGLPFADNIADFLYSSHFIEHLYRSDAEHLLEESYRILKPGGTIRVSIPDLEYAISLYIAGKKEKMLSEYFFIESDDSYYARHKYMYDYEMFSEILRKARFKEIRRCKYREGRTPDLDLLDNRPEDSLFIEAFR
jgi:predicted SAM-dependent methyltransferase